MSCPSCDSESFGVTVDNAGDIVRLCTDCGYHEEASPSEVAQFIEEQIPESAPEVATCPCCGEDGYDSPTDCPACEDHGHNHDSQPEAPPASWFATTMANPAEFIPPPPISVVPESVADMGPVDYSPSQPPQIQGVEAHLIIQDEMATIPTQHIHFVTHDSPAGQILEDMTPEQIEDVRLKQAVMKQKLMEQREQRRQQLPCKFYCPSQEEQDEAPHNWPWDRKLPFGACTSPAVVGQAGIGACQYPTQRGACPARRDPEPVPEATPFITQLVN